VILGDASLNSHVYYFSISWPTLIQTEYY